MKVQEIHSCVAAFYKLTCFLECSVMQAEQTLDQLVQRLYDSGELQVLTAAMFKTACLLPFKASSKLSFFIDAIALQLRAKLHCDAQSESSYEKLCLVQLGLGQLSKHGRVLWKELLSSLLYTFDRLFKLRKYHKNTVECKLATWDLPTYNNSLSLQFDKVQFDD